MVILDQFKWAEIFFRPIEKNSCFFFFIYKLYETLRGKNLVFKYMPIINIYF